MRIRRRRGAADSSNPRCAAGGIVVARPDGGGTLACAFSSFTCRPTGGIHMQKPISPRVHGILDYMTAGFMFALPRVLGWSKTSTRLMDAAAGAATVYSLMTRYELGLVKVLPLKAHLAM